MAESLREACGVFGVYAPGRSVSHLIYDGLFALQHRGQESAGMAVSDGRRVEVTKDMGLVSHVFNEFSLAALQGHLGIGHTRYSTTGSSEWHNAQPVYRTVGEGGFALGHNGNLTNTVSLVESSGMLAGTVSSDSDLIGELVARAFPIEESADGRDLERALVQVLPSLEGAFSLAVMDASRVIGVRDPNGFRPLCLGKLESGWVIASESPALDIVGAHFVREIDPGEMVVIDAAGIRSLRPFPAERINPRLCVVEFVYFARPDAQLYGREVHNARRRMGELLAEHMPVDADMVMGVPDSGVPAAEGYAKRSGIPYGQGLVKNRYIGRTFIAPDQTARDVAVRRKFNALKDNVAGKRLVVVEDSIVRGTTTRGMLKMLRDAGAKEIHMRVTLPPWKWPCVYGIDTGTTAELLAANMSVGEIRDYLGVDTLAYLPQDRLIEAIDAPGAGFCTACVSGEYPITPDVSLSKGMLDVEATPSRV
ncbi:MAG: amidophosphoribosyltransferase [Acidimicrobiales bacterium]|nr:amidophosphoribosyltransferase [Acidimicrobiales bacterium]